MQWRRWSGPPVALILIVTSAVSAPQEFQFETLPREVRMHVEEIRNSCMEADPQFKPYDPMQGITVVDLDGSGAALIVDNEELCAPVRAAGFNCTNRGCDLKIWKQIDRLTWRVVFDEHLYRKFISVTDDVMFSSNIGKGDGSGTASTDLGPLFGQPHRRCRRHL